MTAAPIPSVPEWPSEIFQEGLLAQLDEFRRWSRREVELRGEDPDNLPTRVVEVPVTPEFVAARADWVARWQALLEEGFEHKYAEYDHCYECGGEVVPTENTTEYRREPNPDYDPGKPLPPLAQHVRDGGPEEAL